MEWNRDYRIGIRDIDEQHQAIVQCISSIEHAVTEYDRPSADAAVIRLADLAQAHFNVEEILMRIHDYPRLDEHADHHERFSVQLRTLQERFLTTEDFRNTIESLHEWWDQHIQKHDKAYAMHFLKRTALGKS